MDSPTEYRTVGTVRGRVPRGTEHPITLCSPPLTFRRIFCVGLTPNIFGATFYGELFFLYFFRNFFNNFNPFVNVELTYFYKASFHYYGTLPNERSRELSK